MIVNCSQIAKLKESYVDGLLDADTQVAIDRHAAGCAACRRCLDMALRVRADLPAALKATLGNPTLSHVQASAMRNHLVARGVRSPLHTLTTSPLGARYLSMRRTSLMVPMVTMLLLATVTVGAAQFASGRPFMHETPKKPLKG